MDQDEIHEDLLFLAGRLVHRSAQTQSERRAAEYIQRRLSEFTPNVQLDEFHAIDNYTYLFASYFSEFIVVAILALWWPVAAACYGAMVLCAYLAEYSGFQVFARLLPQYESQNVMARFLGLRPKKTILVTAHYDSGNASPLAHPPLLRWLRPLHFALVACMVLVVASCILDSIGWITSTEYFFSSGLRWSATSLLTLASVAMFYISGHGEDIRGAVGNASGVAALLQIARQLKESPIEEADVWLVATGSQESWMSGMRHLLSAHTFDRGQTFVVNLESVGAGRLCYAEREGLLYAAPAGPQLRAAAKALETSHGLHPVQLRTVPTAGHIALARGYDAVTLIGLDEHGVPPHWNRQSDRLAEVDETQVEQAAETALALIRRL